MKMLTYSKLLRTNSLNFNQARGIAGPIGRLAARILKLRYLALGAGLGGTYTASKKYEEFKNSLPDISFITDNLPSGINNENLKHLVTLLTESTESALKAVKDGFQSINKKEGSILFTTNSMLDLPISVVNFTPQAGDVSVSDTKKVLSAEDLRAALLKNEIEFHKQIEKLMEENRSLKSELLLKGQKPSQKARLKRSLIDMYSEVLDELSSLDSEYNAQDRLPRVVVVGDQSSGKTSVLEMIAQARIFPRGSGEMMTRSPVQVTLSEGPYHVASFKDSSREYDLTDESDLSALRKDIEMRMKASVSDGMTISSDVISLYVKGPGLQRMVLVDLPGIISTVTTGMQSDTRERIKQLARQYMSNPNAIILCIQDGSIDAERSNVTDFVASVDPSGQRTIFVLTKVDLAESSLLNPNRIKQILDGNLFPMKAMGYYAVVTGKGSADDSISAIKKYEEEFFKRSRLFRDGALQMSQMTTNNLSKAVSEKFWQMVKDSVEHQADTYRAIRYNLETEWKISFGNFRLMDRDELFEKCRTNILDDLTTLNTITPAQWEKLLNAELWLQFKEDVFRNIFESSVYLDDLDVFQKKVDIWLRDWISSDLPKVSIEAGRRTLYDQLDKKFNLMKRKPDYDTIFDKLRAVVLEETQKRHRWDNKAEHILRIIQSNVLNAQSVSTKAHWDQSVEILATTLRERLQTINQTVKDGCGPNRLRRWFLWRYRTPEQITYSNTVTEIQNLLSHNLNPTLSISADDLTTVRRNLQSREIQASDDLISRVWETLVHRLYLDRALFNCSECHESFYYFQHGFPDKFTSKINNKNNDDHDVDDGGNGNKSRNKSDNLESLDCREIVLMARLTRTISATSNALRLQIVNDEARRLESCVKQVLNDIYTDPDRLKSLIVGRRVQIAEELKRTMHIQEKLEEFINALNSSE